MKDKKNITVAFQGKKGAYSEQASYQYFKSIDQEINAYGLDYSEDVIGAVLEEETDYGILPIENSIVGHVDINQDLLTNPDLFIFGETFLHIHHHLLGLKGSTLDDITEVHSHPIALGQCKDFLARHKIDPVAHFDTAGSAKSLVKNKQKHVGTISSQLCANYYGLDIIHDRIQKVKKNYTRFLAFSKKSNIPKGLKQEITSMAIMTKHDPGSLVRCLAVFSEHGINLTKLESRPIPEDPFNYIFYIDILAGLDDEKTQVCLNEIKTHARDLKIMGSYPKATRVFD